MISCKVEDIAKDESWLQFDIISDVGSSELGELCRDLTVKDIPDSRICVFILRAAMSISNILSE